MSPRSKPRSSIAVGSSRRNASTVKATTKAASSAQNTSSMSDLLTQHRAARAGGRLPDGRKKPGRADRRPGRSALLVLQGRDLGFDAVPVGLPAVRVLFFLEPVFGLGRVLRRWLALLVARRSIFH